ncbi:MAG: GGDEF domain-containing protein [Alphaproteobacteria bacterium]|nr:GGDEF domain-containing protein [Alphaproteobacteria bacterium]MBV9418452.1 GGDEF domain-containing protein [Alphaproteobacteria bacterium]MBV9540760.1 GGDEF domain-containing protein [Alphaproteobacteria bacterium]MBV9905710.1 GGDEF domain-containing protein [Alphaproteobacteria bacterium]
MRSEREQALGRTTLALMADCDVPPTPDNYRLFYSYSAGENPAIARIIGDLIAARKPFTATLLQELRDRSFPADKTERVVDDVGKTVTVSLNETIALLDAASKDANEYGATLSAASGELGADQSPDALRKLVGNLMASTKDMETRTKALEQDLQKSSAQVNELRSQLDNARRESMTDPLTGIANRKAFDTELKAAIAEAKESGEPLTLFMCDIDRFKTFNDTWGHQTGDHVLKLVAHCLSENVKGRDTAARYGGEEFAVIVRQTPIEFALKLAEQIRGSVQSKKLVKKSTGDILGTITISMGVAQLQANESPAALIHRADSYLYRAKRSGRNCVIGENDPRLKEADAA